KTNPRPIDIRKNEPHQPVDGEKGDQAQCPAGDLVENLSVNVYPIAQMSQCDVKQADIGWIMRFGCESKLVCPITVCPCIHHGDMDGVVLAIVIQTSKSQVLCFGSIA